ncbi:MAG: ABC transporter substrate-binding protein [Oligoflexales bacterium]
MKHAFKSVLFVAASVNIAASSPKNSQLIYGETTTPKGFDPYTNHEQAAQRLSELIFDSLVDISESGEILPSLAERWNIEEQGSSVTFELRKDVHWHNASAPEKKGEAFTAQDVVTTVKLITNPQSDIPNRERFAAIKSATAVNDSTVKIMLNRAMGNPMKVLSFKIIPHEAFASANAIKRDAKEFIQHPIGTGAFQFKQANEEGEVLLTSNPNYFKGEPKLKEIVMKTYLDQSVMAQSLMYSALDMVPYVSPKDLPEIAGDKNLGVIPYEALSYSFFAINTQRGILKDKKVRQALNYSINRPEMLKAFFSGKGKLISGPFPPTSWAYNLEVKPYDFNTDKAKELLREAGLSQSKDGKFLDSNGTPVVLTLAIPLAGESETIKRIALAFQNYLADVGLSTDLAFMDWNVWKEKVLGKHDYDLTLASWAFDDSSNIMSLFHSSSAMPWGNNFVQFKNPLVDSLLSEAAFTNDAEKKRVIYRKLHAVLADESPYVFLWTLQHHAAHNAALQNVQIDPYYFFNRISSWEKKVQHD